MKAKQSYYVYILLCENDNYYTGWTTDLERRYQEHQSGSPKCKYTRAFKPKAIAKFWQVKTKSAAMKLEYQIKQLSKTKKHALIASKKTNL